MKNGRLLAFLAAALLIPACKDGDDGAPGPSAGSGIGYDNAGSGMAATTVQQAIDELDMRLDILEQVPADTVSLRQVGAVPLSYTVPAGQSLVVTYLRASSSSPFTVQGVHAGYRLTSPSRIVLNAGETITAPNGGGSTPRVQGYLVPTVRAPGTAVHVSNGTYTVPAGQTLYVTHVAALSTAGATDILIDGALVIEAGTAPEGESVYIPVAAGKVVSALMHCGVHGYLR